MGTTFKGIFLCKLLPFQCFIQSKGKNMPENNRLERCISFHSICTLHCAHS